MPLHHPSYRVRVVVEIRKRVGILILCSCKVTLLPYMSMTHYVTHSLVVITDCLTLMFNYLTPFHMSASRRSGEFVYFSRSSYIYVCACVCVSLFELFVYVINISAYVLIVVCQQPLMTCAEYVPTSQCMTQKLWQKSVCNYRNTNLTGSARNQRQ
jgi:hypothetical protein